MRRLRLARGDTRRSLAQAARISERHLANLETGQGNASVLLLRQLAVALDCSIAELIGEDSLATPEGRAIGELLRGRDEATLQRARAALVELHRRGRPRSTAHRAVSR